jgi:hypothetical protein
MDYGCEFCQTTYPTMYMIREHTRVAHPDAPTIRKLNQFMTKVEEFMKQTEKRFDELSMRIDKIQHIK